MSELKPCAFCGSTNLKTHVYKGEEPDAFVQCHDCSSTGPSGEEEAGAIEAWNRRAQPAQAGQALSDEDVLRAAARTLDSEVVEVSPLSCIKDFARAIEQAVLKNLKEQGV